MEGNMTILELLVSYKMVEKDDLLELIPVLNRNPETVMVRDLFQTDIFPITKFAQGPFGWSVQAGQEVIAGFNQEGKVKKMRIAEGGIVEIYSDVLVKWIRPSMEGVRVYLPNPIT